MPMLDRCGTDPARTEAQRGLRSLTSTPPASGRTGPPRQMCLSMMGSLDPPPASAGTIPAWRGCGTSPRSTRATSSGRAPTSAAPSNRRQSARRLPLAHPSGGRPITDPGSAMSSYRVEVEREGVTLPNSGVTERFVDAKRIEQ
jgi:hypothetical protein